MMTRTRLAGCALALAIPFTLLPSTAAAADTLHRTATEDPDGGLLDSIGDLLGGMLDPDETADPETPDDPAEPEPTPAPTTPAPTPAPTTPTPTATPSPTPSQPAPGGAVGTPPSAGSKDGTPPAGSGVRRDGIVPAATPNGSGSLAPLLIDVDAPAERAATPETSGHERWVTEPQPEVSDAEPVRASGPDPALPTALGLSAGGLGVLAGGTVLLRRRLLGSNAAHRLEAPWMRRGRHRAPGASWWRRPPAA